MHISVLFFIMEGELATCGPLMQFSVFALEVSLVFNEPGPLGYQLLCLGCNQLSLFLLLPTGILQEETAVNVKHILRRGTSPTSRVSQEDLWLCMQW